MAKRILPDVLTEKEYRALKSFVKKPKHRLALDLGFGCGLRVSEVLNLYPNDIDLKRKLLHVRQGKGKKDRYIPIPKHFSNKWEILPIKLTRQALTQLVKRAAKRAKIKKRVSFHTLRHSCATILLEKGWDIRQVQVQLGHSSIMTTQIYTHISQKDLVKKMDETIWG